MAKKSKEKPQVAEKPAFIIELKPKDYNPMIQQNELVVIDFNATWCPPCRMQEKEFIVNGKNLFTKFPNLKLCSMDTDHDDGISTVLGIKYVPNIFIYYKGIYTALEPHAYKVDNLITLIEKCIKETEEKIVKNPNYLEETRKEQGITV